MKRLLYILLIAACGCTQAWMPLYPGTERLYRQGMPREGAGLEGPGHPPRTATHPTSKGILEKYDAFRP